MSDGLHGWAETTVYPVSARGNDVPVHGDECPECEEPLVEGERVHRVTERDDDAWVHETHIAKEETQ